MKESIRLKGNCIRFQTTISFEFPTEGVINSAGYLFHHYVPFPMKEEHIERLNKNGIKYKYNRRFSLEEDDIIRRNWKNFSKAHNFPYKDAQFYVGFIGNQSEKTVDQDNDILVQLGMFPKLCKRLNDRSAQQVQARICEIFDPNYSNSKKPRSIPLENVLEAFRKVLDGQNVVDVALELEYSYGRLKTAMELLRADIKKKHLTIKEVCENPDLLKQENAFSPQSSASLPEMRRYAKCLALTTGENGDFLQQKYIEKEAFLEKLQKYKLIKGDDYLLEKCARFARVQRFVRDRNKDLFSKVEFPLTLQDKVLIYKACIERLIQQYGPYPVGCENILPIITPISRAECTALHIRKLTDDWIPPEFISKQIKTPEVCRLFNLEEDSSRKLRKKLWRTRRYEIQNEKEKSQGTTRSTKKVKQKLMLKSPTTQVIAMSEQSNVANKNEPKKREKEQNLRKIFVPVLEIKVRRRASFFNIAGKPVPTSTPKPEQEPLQNLNRTESLEEDIFERETSQSSDIGESSYSLPDIITDNRNSPRNQSTLEIAPESAYYLNTGDSDEEIDSPRKKKPKYEKEASPEISLDMLDDFDNYPKGPTNQYGRFLIECEPKPIVKKKVEDVGFSWNSMF